MAIYDIEAIDTQGKHIKVQIEANTSQEAIGKVRTKGYRPINIKETVSGPSPTTPTTAKAEQSGTPQYQPAQAVAPIPKLKRKKTITLFDRVSHKQITQFTQQLSVLQDAGLPLVRSIKILGNQMKPCMLKNNVLDVAEDVESGTSLSEAMARHPRAFDKLYINMVKAGEAGGILDVILQRLAVFMEKAEAIKRKLIAASIYPAVVVTVAILVVMVIMTFIVPKFVDVFHQVRVQLPGLTKLLIAISNFVAGYWFVIIALPIVGFIFYKSFSKTKTGRLIIDKIKLNMPLFGPIFRKASTARFTRTLGTLLQSGVPILDALNIVKGAVGNEVVANAIAQTHDSIKEGETIADPLAQSGVFDDMVVNMIDVGEETGELDKMLLKVADVYDTEVDTAISGLMSIMEPVLIVGLGVTVGFIVVSLFLPLVELLKGIGKH